MLLASDTARGLRLAIESAVSANTSYQAGRQRLGWETPGRLMRYRRKSGISVRISSDLDEPLAQSMNRPKLAEIRTGAPGAVLLLVSQMIGSHINEALEKTQAKLWQAGTAKTEAARCGEPCAPPLGLHIPQRRYRAGRGLHMSRLRGERQRWICLTGTAVRA